MTTAPPRRRLPGELARLREADLPVRGGQVTAYVHDTGREAVHDLAGLDDAGFAGLPASAGVDLAGGGEPETAAVNTILDGPPPAAREALPIRFLPARCA